MSTSTQVIPVPLSGLGAAVDVSTMVGPKTVILTGTFRGSYVLYGSHVGGNLVPLFQFDAGGVEGMRRTFSGALAAVAVKSLASDASGVTASISGESVPGNNTFATLGTLAPGDGGPQPPYDLGTSNYQSGLNFILVGGLEGKLVVEGSSNGAGWNPVGQFSVDPSGPGLLGLSSPEFEPLATEDLVRYVRLNVLGRVTSTLVVTVGGSKSGGGGGSFETLAQTYQVGSGALDQTIVLEDARGGKLVVVTASATFTDTVAFEVLTYGGVGAAFLTAGGMVLGPSDIVVGFAASSPVIPPASGPVGQKRIVVGNAVLNLDPARPNQTQTVAIGTDIVANTECRYSVLIGSSLAVGVLGGDSTAGIVIGCFNITSSFDAVLVGVASTIGGLGANNVAFGNNHNLNNSSLPQSNGGVCLVAGGNVALDGAYSQGLGSYLTVVGDYVFAGGSSGSVYGDHDVLLAVTDGTGAGGTIGTVLSPVDYSVLVGVGGRVSGDRGIAVGLSDTANGNFDVLLGSSLTTPVNGSGVASGTVDSVSDAGGGSVTIHSSDIPAGLASGQQVTIVGTTIYDGTHTVSNVTAGTFDIVAVWSVTAAGTYTARAADGRNVYVGVNIQGAGSTGNADTRQVAIGTDISVLGSSVIAIGASASVTASYGIALGASAQAAGNGVAIGRGANAPAGYVVIGSSVSGGVDRMTVVSAAAGNPNLFSFMSTISGNNETGFYLLCKNYAGVVALQQVTLSAPAGGVSNLQVPNA